MAKQKEGRVYCSAEDVQDGKDLQTDDEVIFKVYPNSQGLRADEIKFIKHGNASSPKGVQKSIEKNGKQEGNKKGKKNTDGAKPKPPSGPPPGAKSLPPNW